MRSVVKIVFLAPTREKYDERINDLMFKSSLLFGKIIHQIWLAGDYLDETTDDILKPTTGIIHIDFGAREIQPQHFARSISDDVDIKSVIVETIYK